MGNKKGMDIEEAFGIFRGLARGAPTSKVEKAVQSIDGFLKRVDEFKKREHWPYCDIRKGEACDCGLSAFNEELASVVKK